MLVAVKKFLMDEEGATAVEYGLIIGLVAVGILLALTALQGGLSGLFQKVADTLTGASG